MPRCDYIWNSTVTLQEILETPEDSSVGFFVEVDLKYPQNLHDIHNGLPLAPENLEIRSSWFSDYAKTFKVQPNKSAKLMETLFHKKNYVCHYENLKFYVKHGLIDENLRRVCQFQQSR